MIPMRSQNNTEQPTAKETSQTVEKHWNYQKKKIPYKLKPFSCRSTTSQKWHCHCFGFQTSLPSRQQHLSVSYCSKSQYCTVYELQMVIHFKISWSLRTLQKESAMTLKTLLSLVFHLHWVNRIRSMGASFHCLGLYKRHVNRAHIGTSSFKTIASI